MPPKKTLKAIAAEKKKKNTADAENILAQLTRETGETAKSSRDTVKSSRDTVKSSRDTVKSSRDTVKSSAKTKISSRDSTDNVKKSSKDRTEKVIASQSKKKDTGKPKEVASKPESTTQSVINDQVMVMPTTKENAVPMETNFDSSSDGGVSVIDHPRAIERAKSSSTSQRTNSVESSASGSKVSKALVSASKARKPGNTKIGDYQYEIDCQKVADAIDVTDLQRYLEQQLKVNGKKNNLDGTISIHCKGNKVVIKSNTFLPKKSLRFLSKKFLKKNWNIRVVSKNVHSYEYKYIGSL